MTDNPDISPPSVGVIGLGAIGGNVAERLLESGIVPIVFDVQPEAVDRLVAVGAKAARSAHEAARVGVLITSLPSDAVLSSVVDDTVLDALAGGVLLEISTVLPTTMTEIGIRAERCDVAVVDAPFSGGTEDARSGRLVFYVGAEDVALARARPVLALLGTVQHVGAVGQGKVLKLVNNLMSIGNLVVAVEAFEIGRRMGLDPQRMFDIVSGSGGRSAMFEKRMPRILADDVEPKFSLGLSAKDVGLALSLAEHLALELSAATGIAAVLGRGVDDGLGSLDLTAVSRVVSGADVKRDEGDWSGHG